MTQNIPQEIVLEAKHVKATDVDRNPKQCLNPKQLGSEEKR